MNVDWQALSNHAVGWMGRELARAEIETKYWFEIAHWLALLAVFSFAEKIVHAPSFAAGFLNLIVSSMRFALVTLLTARLALYLEKPISWLIARAKVSGFIDYDATAAVIKLILIGCIWWGAYFSIDSAVSGIIAALPSKI